MLFDAGLDCVGGATEKCRGRRAMKRFNGKISQAGQCAKRHEAARMKVSTFTIVRIPSAPVPARQQGWRSIVTITAPTITTAVYFVHYTVHYAPLYTATGSWLCLSHLQRDSQSKHSINDSCADDKGAGAGQPCGCQDKAIGCTCISPAG